MNEDSKSINGTKKTRKLYLVIVFLCLACIVFFILYKSSYNKSAGEQLAAIENSLAIPDSQNAAIYYNNFFYDSNNISILNALRSYVQSSHVLPWKSENDPSGSAALKNTYPFFEKQLILSPRI